METSTIKSFETKPKIVNKLLLQYFNMQLSNSGAQQLN